MFIKWLSFIFLFCFSLTSFANNNENVTAKYFQFIQNNPELLKIFIGKMPKGGDLHIHLLGATYAENLINYGKNDGFCVRAKNSTLFYSKKCLTNYLLSNVAKGGKLYDKLIDDWSLKNFVPTSHESPHDHFFTAFFKFIPILNKHGGDILAELVTRARDEKVSYLELMVLPDFDIVLSLDKKIPWNNDFNIMRANLLKNDIKKIETKIYKQTLMDEKIAENKMGCFLDHHKNNCQVTVRYQYQSMRDISPKLTFAQLLVGFELATCYPDKFVGINIAGPEDNLLALRNYKLQMQMIAFLHVLYPKVKISLHAGELRLGLVPPEALRFHINEALNIAHANRIGHGVDIAYEKNALQILQQMENKHILVEINLTSNAKILEIKGKSHPFMLYLSHKVPLALSTDDDGVLRTDMNHEFLQAALTYHLSYLELKKLIRNSLTYSFLPGLSLWKNSARSMPVSSCSPDELKSGKLSQQCHAFLKKSKKLERLSKGRIKN